MIMAPGGFFVFGVLIALANKLAAKVGKEPVTEIGCAACPNAAACAHCDIISDKNDEKTAENDEKSDDNTVKSEVDGK